MAPLSAVTPASAALPAPPPPLLPAQPEEAASASLATVGLLLHPLATALFTTHFAYVYDHHAQALVFVSDGIARLVGEQLGPDELPLGWFTTRIHPDDAPIVAQAILLVNRYLTAQSLPLPPDFVFSLDYRLRHADGSYRRVLHQTQVLTQAPGTGALHQTLAIFSDLTHHKRTTEVQFHVNQPGFAAFVAQQQSGATLTPRQQQVLALVLDGFTSRQIAHHLGMTEDTAKTHRRNVLHKTHTHSFHDLLPYLKPAENVSAGV